MNRRLKAVGERRHKLWRLSVALNRPGGINDTLAYFERLAMRMIWSDSLSPFGRG